MLTTKDNPYDPHTDYDKWLQWDEDNGYFTQNYLARMANIPPGEEDEDVIEQLTNRAMLDIVYNSPLDNWIIV